MISEASSIGFGKAFSSSNKRVPDLNLEKAKKQAFDYFPGIKERELPRMFLSAIFEHSSFTTSTKTAGREKSGLCLKFCIFGFNRLLFVSVHAQQQTKLKLTAVA